jgi:propionyl-CoA carboxylase alpha chain
VCKKHGCDAVHPGYGFLSENADFAEACAAAGITFIGPPPEAIRSMGDKTAARALMKAAGVPMAPGTTEAVRDAEEAATVAADIGYPVLLKAAAGGGGKGMRVVHSVADLSSSLDAARREAESAFGDGRVFVEKFIEEPRHIEFQILADQHGNCVHLFERECSIQRRHQKVIEEAPSSVVTPRLREEMGRAAIQAAMTVNYFGAGTIEFLVDSSGKFYFMEMNTRLQVEHPVTEWITGFDLVAEQVRIAAGEALGYSQDEVLMRGHAIECRVYAEDPSSGFLPDPGLVSRHRLPSGAGTRVDAGVEEGDEIPIHYDPMVSKLSVWGSSREQAIERMLRALGEYEILGVRTTIPFCRFAVNHQAFRSGDYSTHFVARHFEPVMSELSGVLPKEHEVAAAVGATMETRGDAGAINESGMAGNTATNGSLGKWVSRRELR